ncbi:MAG: ywqD 2 [Verrucomicrobiales bacterium]|nr:ywqD 2 [Verrucomicrobiales bacterium]
MDLANNDAQPEKLHFLDYWRIVKVRKTIIFTVFILVLATTVGLTIYWPKSYASMVKISVEKDTTDVEGPFRNYQVSSYIDPFWVQTEFERITSKPVLYRVIHNLDLNRRWTERYKLEKPLVDEETYEILENQVRAKQSKNTSNIEIWVYSRDKKEAPEIANDIVEVYRQIRAEQRSETKARGLKTLLENLDKKNKEVESAQKAVGEMRRTNNIIDLSEGAYANTQSAPTFSGDTLRQIEQRRIEANDEYVQYSTLLNEIKQIDRKGLGNALATAYPDPRLSELLLNLAQSHRKLNSLSPDLGKEHPEYAKAKLIQESDENDIKDTVTGIIQGLGARVASLKAKLTEIEVEVEKAKQEQISLSAKYRPYYDAKRDLDTLLRVRDALKMKTEEERIESEIPVSSGVRVVDPAVAALKPARPIVPLNIALGVIVGLILGVGLAFFIEYLDTNVKTIDDVERALQSPVLGVIPQDVGLVLDEGQESPHAEAYRVLRTNILFSRKDEKWNTLTIVSGGVGEGKSTTIMNLATVFAQNGDRVLIVDSDLRRPTLHKILRLSNAKGLTNYLLRQNSLDEVIQETTLPTLHFLASGKLPSSSMGILSSAQMKDLIHELKSRYDFVFFDSPPIMGVSDASILASEVDMTLQVVQYRRYPQAMTLRAKQSIQKIGGNMIGIVLNNISVGSGDNYYYYSGYYYSNRNSDSDDKPKRGEKKIAPAAAKA